MVVKLYFRVCDYPTKNWRGCPDYVRGEEFSYCERSGREVKHQQPCCYSLFIADDSNQEGEKDAA